jgi:hypothetical protein
MPRWTHRGWPDTIPYNIHKAVGYRPTRWHTKLLSLQGPIKSYMCQYATQTCSSGQDDRSLTDIGRGYHLGALNFRSDHSSSFPSSILHFPLIARSVSNYAILSTIQVLNIPISNQGIKAINVVCGICHSTSNRVLFTKHITTNGFSTTIGARWYKKGIMHSKDSFNSYNINAQIK